MTDAESVTLLLQRWRAGDRTGLDTSLPQVYGEMKRLARSQLQRQAVAGDGMTLQPTQLVNEAYLRLVDGISVDLKDRGHFLAIVARTMRQILIDHARSSHAAKRDGGQRVTLAGLSVPGPADSIDLLALSEAIERLETIDERKARVVEMRVFAGLEFAEIEALTGWSRATLDRDFRAARAWLYRELEMGGAA